MQCGIALSPTSLPFRTMNRWTLAHALNLSKDPSFSTACLQHYSTRCRVSLETQVFPAETKQYSQKSHETSGISLDQLVSSSALGLSAGNEEGAGGPSASSNQSFGRFSVIQSQLVESLQLSHQSSSMSSRALGSEITQKNIHLWHPLLGPLTATTVLHSRLQLSSDGVGF